MNLKEKAEKYADSLEHIEGFGNDYDEAKNGFEEGYKLAIENIDWDKILEHFKYTHTRGKNYNWTINDSEEIVNWFKEQIIKQLEQ